MIKKFNNLEMSKKILIIIFIIYVLLLIVSIALAFFLMDSSILAILAGGIVSAMSVAIGFYYWKAKQENVIKLQQTLDKDIIVVDDEDFAEDLQYYQTKDISKGV